jgi:membrane-bound lytic murein transglycosylase B
VRRLPRQHSWLPAGVRPAALAVALALAAVGLPAQSASAQTASQAQAAAHQAAVDVNRLVPQVKKALTAYQQALARLGQDTSSGLTAAQQADQADQSAASAQQQQIQRVRALYMSGGQAGLLASILNASGPADLAERIDSMRRLMQAQTVQVRWAQDIAVVARQDATSGLVRADTAGVSAQDVQAAYERVLGLLNAAQARLDELSAQAQTLADAQAVAAELRALAAQAASAGAQAAASASGHGIPPAYLLLYRAAATTCPGLDWHLLAAIGQVESGHGHNVGPSAGGAEGPMQFLPATFAAYAVDGNGDGVLDIWNPADAIYTAAHYLCANGAGTPSDLYTAIFHYNHADWYVQMVLRVAADLRVRYPF